jgi:hypothetical protein
MKARKTIALFLISLFYALSAFAAESIAGKVTNLTTRKPAANTEVILLRLEKGMDEEARARTDAQGGFVLPLPAVAGSQHMIRVVHQGVNYDQALSGKGPVEITVFDTVRDIPNLQANIGMAQLESDGEMLKVTEMYAIANNSFPPVTQLRPRNFEVSLAQNAVLDSFTIKRGGGIWVVVTPVPVQGQSGRYAVDYPLRPGETLFKFIYHLPYTGPTTLHVKPAYPVANFAVMHPPSMKFKASNPRAFTSPGVTRGLQIEQAVRKPVVREVPSFEISGIGLAPPASRAAESSPAVRLSPTPAAGSSAAASQPVNQGQQEVGMWAAVLSGLAALLAASVFMIWRKRKRAA